MVFSVLQDRTLLAKCNNQDSSLQFITDSAMKCSVYFRPHITLVSKVSQQLNLWTYLSVKSRIASYACTSALCRVACDVFRYGISIASLSRFYPSQSPWQVVVAWDLGWLVSSWYSELFLHYSNSFWKSPVCSLNAKIHLLGWKSISSSILFWMPQQHY